MSNGRPKRYSPGRERRDELVKAAIAVIADRGLERVTFRAVSEQAGFPASTTSYFFGSVDEVVDAAITRVAETVTGHVAALLDNARSGAITRDELAESLIDLVSGQDNDDSIAQFEAYLAVRRRPELAEPVHRIMRSIEQATEEALDAFGVKDPQMLAKQYIALIDGFTLQEIARPGGQESRRALGDLMTRLLP